jgi:hypothetical protein
MGSKEHLPELQGKMFRCPACNGVAQQEWSNLYLVSNYPQNPQLFQLRPIQPSGADYRVSCCHVCERPTIWRDREIVWPMRSTVSPASPDMPADVKSDYEEARRVAGLSPKSAAALLRLAIQRLCIHLGGTGENLNADIKQLVKDGLPPKIQQALDVVRVTGNNAVHPGQINFEDNPKTVAALFGLVNIVVEDMITQPLQVSGLFEALPDSSKEQIKKRDGS